MICGGLIGPLQAGPCVGASAKRSHRNRAHSLPSRAEYPLGSRRCTWVSPTWGLKMSCVHPFMEVVTDSPYNGVFGGEVQPSKTGFGKAALALLTGQLMSHHKVICHRRRDLWAQSKRPNRSGRIALMPSPFVPRIYMGRCLWVLSMGPHFEVLAGIGYLVSVTCVKQGSRGFLHWLHFPIGLLLAGLAIGPLVF